MSNILKEICENKLIEVEERKKSIPLDSLVEKIKQQQLPRGFSYRVKKCKENNESALILEIKKKSPSKGLIREDFDPVEIAKIYQSEEAACISVLTDEKYFAGADEYLKEVKKVTEIPILRKDFILDPYQVFESRALGADCILLIMTCLNDDLAKELEDTATSLGMDVLVEVHDEQELQRALKLDSKLIGVNNRNLKTMKVDLNTSKELSKLIPEDHITVCESGISSKSEISEMMEYGFSAFLIGESLMREKDMVQAIKRLKNGK